MAELEEDFNSYVSPNFCHCSEAADAWHWRCLELVYMSSKSITMLKNILTRSHNNLANKLFIIPWNNSLIIWQETAGSMAMKSVVISLFLVKDEWKIELSLISSVNINIHICYKV